MNQNLKLLGLFVLLVLLQVLVLNNILLFGHINPYVYITFIFIFPFSKNRFPILTYAFFLGLFIDLFSNSGGIHAIATLTIAAIRVYFFRVFFQKTEADYDFFNLKEEAFGKIFNYTATLTLIHHFIIFLLINFSFKNFSSVLFNTISSTLFTLILYFLGRTIFSRKQ